MSASTIKLAEFISVCVHLAEESGKIIREVQASETFKIFQKDKTGASPVTEADLRVQATLEANLRDKFPNLHLHGEESAESIKDIKSSVDPATLTKEVMNFVSTDFLNEEDKKNQASGLRAFQRQAYTLEEICDDGFTEFSTEDAVVWIDPLDGTSDFVKGTLSAVTVLIGLSIKGYARCGIVHQVFSDADEQKSVTYWGTGEHGVFKYDYEPSMTLETCLARKVVKLDALNNRGEPDATEMTRVAASLSHFNDRMKSIIQSIEPVEIKRIGGAGNKANNLAINNVDAYIHPSPGLMHWDLCAPEALIKGMGGYATNLCGERLKYPLGTDCKLKGLLLGKSKKHHKAIQNKMGAILETACQELKFFPEINQLKKKDMLTKQIGWIGTGVMGKHMAKHLMNSGYSLNVFNRTASKADELVAAGAKFMSAKEVAASSDILFLMLGYPHDVEDMMLGSQQLLTHMKAGSVVVDHTTSSPTLAEQIAVKAKELGIGSVDAPVSGGDIGAQNGKLVTMAGGEQADFATVEEMMNVYSLEVQHMGMPGRGQHTKAANQIMIANNIFGTCEGLLYGHAAGLDLDQMIKLLSKGSAGSFQLEKLGPRILKKDYDPGFYVEHFVKDLGIAIEESRRMGLCLPGMAQSAQFYNALVAQGGSRMGTQGLMTVIEKLSNKEVKKYDL